MTYSIDLHKRVIKFVETECAKSEASRIFSVGRLSVYKWLKMKKRKSTLIDRNI